MKLQRFGKTDLHVSNLCFGGNVFGWTVTEAQSFALLDAFTAAGGNFIDTADVYSRWVPGHRGGESETVIGNWLAARPGMRPKVVIATKVGMEMAPDRKGLSASWIARAVEDSLRRLRCDVIDLYQSHTDDVSVSLEETLGAYDRLIRAGKVRYIGASNYSAARLSESLAVSRANGLPQYVSLQPLFNLYDRAVFERELQPLCARENIAVINFYALAAGFLTGKYRDASDAGKSPRGQGVIKKYVNPRGLRILQALDIVAAEQNAKPGVGLTQNLVTGIWVGTEYRSVHFRSNTGQGSRMALPIFGKFMEKAIKNKNPEVAIGRFPKPKVKITKKYQCNFKEAADSMSTDSLVMNPADSLIHPIKNDSLIFD